MDVVKTPCLNSNVSENSVLKTVSLGISNNVIEEAPQCGRFFLVLRLTNNRQQICCTPLRIQKEFFTTPFLILPTLLGFPSIVIRIRSGAEERGVGYRVKETRIYVQLQLQHLIFKTSSEEQTVDLKNKT